MKNEDTCILCVWKILVNIIEPKDTNLFNKKSFFKIFSKFALFKSIIRTLFII